MRLIGLIGILYFLSLGAARAAGPILDHKDPDDQREFINIYQDIRKSSARIQSQASTGTYCDQLASNGNSKNGFECFVNGNLVFEISGNDFQIYPDTSSPTNLLQGALSAGQPVLQGRTTTFPTVNPWNLGSSSFKWASLYVSSGIVGTTTNDEAPAGYVREWSTGTYGGTGNGSYTNSAPNNQYTAFSTITIPSPGDWMVCGTIQTNLNGATMTRNNIALSLFSGNTTTDQLSGKNDIDIPVPTSVSAPGGQLCYRFEFTAASTVYVKAKATFSAGQPQYLGFGWAERRR